MLSSHYTLASGILTRQREIDVIGNNLVNIQTPGYRTERVITGSFEEALLARQNGDSTTTIGTNMSTIVLVDDVVSLFHSGTIEQTGHALDMAINGEGFFAVTGTDGEDYLTRNGKFGLDEAGYLVLPNIGRVQGTSGDIHVGSSDFTVDTDGKLYDIENTEIGQLLITAPDADSALVKTPNNMYQIAPGGTAINATDIQIMQGTVELSNVDMNKELTTMIEVQRAFQSCSAAFQTIDAMNRKAISQLGAL